MVHTIRLFLLGVIHKIFQANLGASYPNMPRLSKVAQKSYLRPHAAQGYSVKLQRQGYMAQRTTDNIYIIMKITIEQTSVGLA